MFGYRSYGFGVRSPSGLIDPSLAKVRGQSLDIVEKFSGGVSLQLEALELAGPAVTPVDAGAPEADQPPRIGETPRSDGTTAVEGRADYGVGATVRTSVPVFTGLPASDIFSNQDINGVLSGRAWGAAPGPQTLTFSFPTAASNYGTALTYSDPAPFNGFQALSTAQEDVVRYSLALVSRYTLLSFDEITETDNTHATLRFAGSAAPPTSYAYYPSASETGGDTFYGNIRNLEPTRGGYAFGTILHELGHQLGLKHGQEVNGTYGVLPDAHNSNEWSIMTYYAYVGTPNDFVSQADGSVYQTFMINDIAALQYMYGANFDSNANATLYTWSSVTGEMSINGVGQGFSTTNTIIDALWDGNGVDTYDLANYTTNLNIDLRPGYWSTFSVAQLADLDGANPGQHLAAGNIANAHLFNNDLRSLIENAVGGVGDDRLHGNQGDNDLSGGDGNDTFVGEAGNDIYRGGLGSDTVDYSGAGGRIEISLAEPNPQLLFAYGLDQLISIENLIGSAFDDLLTGNGGPNRVIGGEGNDTLLGGGGVDTVLYTGAAAGVVVSLGIAGAQDTIGAGADTLSAFENLTGSAFDDTLSGNGGANRLEGGEGYDTVSYAAALSAVTVDLAAQTASGASIGADTLVSIEHAVGGAASDTLRAHNGVSGPTAVVLLKPQTLANTTTATAVDLAPFFELRPNPNIENATTVPHATVQGVSNGTGREYYSFAVTAVNTSVTFDIDGTSGFDSLMHIYNAGGVELFSEDDAPLDPGSTSGLDGRATFVLATPGIYFVSVTAFGAPNPPTGATYTLHVSVPGAPVSLLGAKLSGGAGADLLVSGAYGDTLDGDGGVDTADYSGAASAVVASLLAGTTTGGGGNDTLLEVENLRGGASGDTLTGDGGVNRLEGAGGNDTLDGGDGADYVDGGMGLDALNGGAGDDTLRGGASADALDGDGGSDTADFRDKGVAVVLTLAGAAVSTATVGGAADDTVREVENVYGGTVSDTLTGDGFANLFRGGGGADLINGFGGVDTIDFRDKTAAVVLTLAAGANATATVGGLAEDVVRNVEALFGGSAGDTLTGDALANLFRGGVGVDTINGAGGSDTIDFSDKTAAVVLTLAGSATATATVGGVNEDVVRNVESVWGGTAADTLTGDSFANLFKGGGGADLINGFGGIDTIDFSDKSAAVALTLTGGANATAVVGGVAEDVVRNVENVTGGAGDDTLTGDVLANVLSGLGGNDVLRGGGGADRLFGGIGADRFAFGPALSDSTVLAAGRDTIRDFTPGDRIDLQLIDADTTLAGNQAFVLGAPAGSAGRLTVTSVGSGAWLVQGYVDANASADFGILVYKTAALVAADFLL